MFPPTYELARQMQRSTRHYWPRAESKIYEEPKKLVAHGLATATREYTGRRPRTVYAITSKGRKALRRWLDQPGQPPLVEFEGAVKALFAEQGTKAQLLTTLRSIRAQAEQTRAEHIALAADLAQTGGPFPTGCTSTSSSSNSCGNKPRPSSAGRYGPSSGSRAGRTTSPAPTDSRRAPRSARPPQLSHSRIGRRKLTPHHQPSARQAGVWFRVAWTLAVLRVVAREPLTLSPVIRVRLDRALWLLGRVRGGAG